MARIRSVKPEIRTSLTVAEWPREVRYAWILLWGYLDDEGRGRDDTRLIAADLFPLDRDVTEKKLNTWLDLMATTKTTEDDIPPLCRYEVAGQRYIHAVKWADHQRINRPSSSRLPPCPIHERSVNGSRKPHGTFSESDSERLSEGSPHSRAPAEQGAGNKGTGSEGGTDSVNDQPPDPSPDRTRTEQLLQDHLDHLAEPPGTTTIDKTRAAIWTLIRDGRNPDTITAALAKMRDRQLSPSLLGQLADEVIPTKTTKPTPWPPWCGQCDRDSRMIETEDDDGRPLAVPCPQCRPARASA